MIGGTGATDGVVLGEGPKGARLFICGEAPARSDLEEARPWSGRMGRYLHNTLRMAGLPPRELLYITNILKQPAIDNEKEYLMEQQTKEWEGVLYEELAQIHPQVVASFGSWSTKWFLRNYSTGYPDTNDLDWLHGVPRVGVANWGRFILVPCFNPAAGLHDSESLPKIFADLQAIRDVLAGRVTVTPIRPKAECRLLPVDVPARAMLAQQVMRATHLAVDTEGYPGDVWMASFTTDGRIGWVINRPDELKWIVEVLNAYSGTVIMHNAPHDEQVLATIGLRIDQTHYNLECTMQLAKYLNTEPGGLKALAWRLLAIEMSEYSDIIRPMQRKYLLDYIPMLQSYQFPKPAPELEWKNGAAKVKTPQSLTTRIKKIMTDLGKNPDLDLFKRWESIPERTRQMGVEVFGEPRAATLWDVEADIARDYSGTDAVATWLVYWELKEKIRRVYGDTAI